MVKIKWHLQSKQVEKRRWDHDSDKDEESYIESKQISQTIIKVRIKWHLQAEQVENRVDLHHDSNRDKENHIESNKYHKQLWLKLNDTYRLNK